MSSLLRWARNRIRRAPSLPLRFPTSGFALVPDSHLLEEERFEDFRSGTYYPVNIGDVFASKYQVIGKLGFGVSSTVWLAHDLDARQHVALKIYKREGVDQEEFDIYQQLGKGSPSHPGYLYIRTALNTFTISRPGGDHYCLVQKPMWDSFRDLLDWNPTHRFTEPLLKAGLSMLFLALEYLHTECKLVHTDIKADNILQDIKDNKILDAFTKAEMEEPSPRKFINDAPVYASRRFAQPDVYGNVVLGDFGSAVRGDVKRNHDAQPNVYRSPEVMLKTDWSYPIDIWNVGVMIWDIFEGKHMFYGNDPIRGKYLTRAHLAEVIALLGPPPVGLVRRGVRSHEFFTEDGQWKAGTEIPLRTSLEESEQFLRGKNKEVFLDFMRGMLQWRPENRKTARQLLEHRWLHEDIEE